MTGEAILELTLALFGGLVLWRIIDNAAILQASTIRKMLESR